MTLSPIINESYYRCVAKINLSAISHNLFEIKKCLSDGVKMLAVIKADSYGHGSVPVSKTIEDHIDYFGVTSIDEAIEVRREGITKPVLALSYIPPRRFSDVVDNDITATVYDLGDAELLSKAAAEKGKTASVHIAVDTGMGRIGLTPDKKGADTAKKIAQLKNIFVEGVFSHYACADSADKSDAALQTALFDKFIDLLSERGVNPPIKHICNSAGTISLSKQYDMCRVGVLLYGLYPSDEVDKSKLNLIPAMEIISHVVHVKTVPAGYKIGYGHIYEAPSERVIATVSIGYADGYSRSCTGKGYVLIKGKKAPVVGKVCMDQIMVDVTDIDGVRVGERAVIMGVSNSSTITAEELGEMSNSFNYEVICNFTKRVARLYYKDGKLV
ncbi:MAG: alanine racemase [Clostridia bacterium]|nr:alanine racemase [Clostridia bacterium]